mgnify:CR=1 FL=1
MAEHLEKARKACEIASKIAEVLGGKPSDYLQDGWDLVAKHDGDNKSLKGGDKSKAVK